MSKFFKRANRSPSPSDDEEKSTPETSRRGSEPPGASNSGKKETFEDWIEDSTSPPKSVEERQRLQIESLQAELAKLYSCIAEQDEKLYKSLLKQKNLNEEVLELKQKNKELKKEKKKEEERLEEIIMIMEKSKGKKINYVKEDPDEKLIEENEKLKLKLTKLNSDLVEEKIKNLSLMNLNPDDPKEIHLNFKIKNLELSLADRDRDVESLEKKLKNAKKSENSEGLEEILEVTRSELEYANEQIAMIFENNEISRQQENSEYEKQIRELKDRLIAREEEIWELKNN